MPTLAMTKQSQHPFLPRRPMRMETYRRIPEAHVPAERSRMLALLKMVGWDNAQADAVRGIPTGHLSVLVKYMAPDFDLYMTWGNIGRIGRLTDDAFAALIQATADFGYTPADVQALMAYGQGAELNTTPQRWLVDHMSAGNRIRDVLPWGKLAPGWIVRWARTNEPPTSVPEVTLGDGLLWVYMDIIMKFPAMPEEVVAHTLMSAPDPYGVADTPGAWLMAC